MTKRTPLIIGNWKTNKKVDEVYEFYMKFKGNCRM
ncbi:Uncharacterised protein [Weissella viridescens]|uniref:Uncharacterized protein n=1 Tax=Weissella viridescens TaxID=1629 RepID=A0A380P3F7_WEIVI|nr:Uncharacterised protein [Weissella viridescens]